MTTPHPKISDEMVIAYRDAVLALTDEAGIHSYAEFVKAGLDAVAPLIAAQVLRDARWQIMHVLWSDSYQESDDLEDTEIVGRALCAVWGHEPTPDHCGIPEHDYCGCCGERTPNQAPRAPSAAQRHERSESPNVVDAPNDLGVSGGTQK